jgi:hypothetical protein
MDACHGTSPVPTEVPGTNGQGKSREECLASLREEIALILEYRRKGFRDSSGIYSGTAA